jgi:hypothetical protein
MKIVVQVKFVFFTFAAALHIGCAGLTFSFQIATKQPGMNRKRRHSDNLKLHGEIPLWAGHADIDFR